MDHNDPASFLRSPPTPEEHTLAERVELHDGAHIPFHMFAKVAVRQHHHALWIGDVEGLKRWFRRNVRISLGTLFTTLLALGGYFAHRIAAGATAEANALAQERSFMDYRDTVRREMDRMEQDIRDLRRDLRRLSGNDPSAPNSDIDYNPDPDKFSDLGRWDEVLASAIVKPRPTPQSSCGSICSSSIECNSGILKPCPFCNFGVCKSTRPELPTPPPDAGVDAAPGGTTP